MVRETSGLPTIATIASTSSARFLSRVAWCWPHCQCWDLRSANSAIVAQWHLAVARPLACCSSARFGRVTTSSGVCFPCPRLSVQTSLNPSAVVPLDHDRVNVDEQVAKKKPSRERGPAGEQGVQHGRQRDEHPREMP